MNLDLDKFYAEAVPELIEALVAVRKVFPGARIVAFRPSKPSHPVK